MSIQPADCLQSRKRWQRMLSFAKRPSACDRHQCHLRSDQFAPTDECLLWAVNHGNKKTRDNAIATLIRRNQSALWTYLPTRVDEDDVVQMTSVRLIKLPEKYYFADLKVFLKFAKYVAKQVAMDENRREKAQKRMPLHGTLVPIPGNGLEPEQLENCDQDAYREKLKEFFLRLRARLNEKDRQHVELLLKGFNAKQIAEKLGYDSGKSARSAKSRIIGYAKERMTDEFENQTTESGKNREV